MKNIALFPGSFDPITNGHVNIIERAAGLFSEVIVAIGIHHNKQGLFSVEQRADLAEQALQHYPNVQVTAYEGLTVDFALECGANILLRSFRNSSDVDYEMQLEWINRKLAPELETVYLSPEPEYQGISSTMVKDIAQHGGDFEAFVPAEVAEALGNEFRLNSFSSSSLINL